MKRVGVFNLINWSFLDQRPQVTAKMLSAWGYETIYCESFEHFTHWHDTDPHPVDKYIQAAYELIPVQENLWRYALVAFHAWKRFQKLQPLNKELDELNARKIAELRLDFAIVNDPRWGRVLHGLGIPFIYDHVDDTHHMEHVIKDFFHDEAVFCEKHSVKNLYIQPNIARRYDGLYVPNGFFEHELHPRPQMEKEFDAVVLSCIADWFDIDSVLATKKKILMIGPIETPEVKEAYLRYKRDGGKNVTWIPRLPRELASLWLNKAHVGLIPFRQDHGVVDYVMPLKIIEYYYLGLSAVCYVNKGVMEAFGDHVYSYSPTGWLGYPDLDGAIDQAVKDKRTKERKALALEYTWPKVMAPLRKELERIGQRL